MNYKIYSTTKGLIILFTLIAFTGIAQNSNNEHKLLYKKNKVKSVKTYEYKYRNGKTIGSGKLTSFDLYDTTGLLMESNSTISLWYRPNTFGDFCFFMITLPFSHKSEYHNIYEYDTNENEIKKCDIDLNYCTHHSYVYDSINRIIEKKKKDGDSWHYTYDSVGNIIKEIWFDSRGVINFTDVLEYNQQNKVVKKTRYHADGTIYFYFINEYYDEGRIIKEMRFQNGSLTNVYSKQYDSYGNYTRMQYYYGQTMTSDTYYKNTYNYEGLIESIIVKSSDERKMSCIKFEYEYYN